MMQISANFQKVLCFVQTEGHCVVHNHDESTLKSIIYQLPKYSFNICLSFMFSASVSRIIIALSIVKLPHSLSDSACIFMLYTTPDNVRLLNFAISSLFDGAKLMVGLLSKYISIYLQSLQRR